MLTFDLYCASADAGAESFSRRQPGDIIDLDGIDGFFDEYFGSLKNGDVIRFVSSGPLASWPTNLQGMLELPFVSAEIVENHEVRARARLIEISTLGDWSRSREEPATPLSQLSFPIPIPIDLPALLREAQPSGSSYWYSAAKFWRSLSEVTAVGALAGRASTSLWILTTNAMPNYFGRVTI